jgi:ribonuclease VapC
MRVLDASAILALLADEPGSEPVAQALAEGAVVSSVNLSEVTGKLCDWGMAEPEIREVLGVLALNVVSFDEPQAILAGVLRNRTRTAGPSLGDRACLALALQEQLTAITADRGWAGLVAEVPLEILR